MTNQLETAEFTAKAVIAGVVFGVVFGMANAYLGLRVGMTVSTSIPIAVLTVALFKAGAGLWGKGTLLEANISQTIGSASTSLASGTIFTIPALFLWNIVPGFYQIAGLALLGGILGVCAMIPLRRLLIVKAHDELPYPEGTACAEVLRATVSELKGSHWIFIGLAAGFAAKLILGLFALIPSDVTLAVPGIAKAQVALEVAPALLAVGYILGYRQSAIMLAGGLVSSLCLIPLISAIGGRLDTPLFPEIKLLVRDMSVGQLWGRYVRYIGAGAVAAAGIVTVIRSAPTMYSSLRAVVGGMRNGAGAARQERTDRDLPGSVILVGTAIVVASLIFVPGLIAGNMAALPRTVAALGVALFGMMFVAVSARIVGLIGVSSNPVSGMTLVTLLSISGIFAALGWVDSMARAAVLTVGTVVCIAASKAGDISQDLKTGYLVGATPAKQQLGQLIGASFACWAIAGTMILLGRTYTFGSAELPAPQATLMKTVIEGVLSGQLPWELVSTGAGLAVCALLAGLPGLPFAIGLYLPISSMTPIFVGGIVRRFIDSRSKKAADETNPGILCASGFIAGEGICGIIVAGVFAGLKRKPPEEALMGGNIGALLSVALVAVACWLLIRAARGGESESRV